MRITFINLGNLYKFGYPFLLLGFNMSETVRIKKKFNVTIPKNLRKKLEVKVGQLVNVSLDGDVIVLKPLPYDLAEKLEKLIGSLQLEQIKRQAERRIVKESKPSLAKKLR